MKKTKMEKGITLIALIISIVILLILAVVTIGAVKESSIIGNSKKASSEYTIAQEKETLQLALGEWAMQKYSAEENTETFENFMDGALSDKDVAISSTAGETLKVRFNKTDNSYIVKSDGTITGPDSSGSEDGETSKPTELEKYIFGEDLQGRDLTEIAEIDEGIIESFKNTANDPEITSLTFGLDDTDCTEEYSKYLETAEDWECYMVSAYFKYESETYKFKYSYCYYEVGGDDKEIYNTEASYGLTKIEVDTENTRVGKTVKYDDKTWTILYDDATNGLQMICNETYQYNNDNFYLGYDDSSITDWNSLNTETEDFKIADLDGNKKLNNDLEKSIYSYNNAITTLNTACENLFKDEDGNYKNSNIIDVRCVGSNPTSKNSENATPYTSENLAKWPENDSIYSAGIGNGRGKSTDYNYVTDFDRMVALGTYIGYNSSNEGEDYWLASRFVDVCSGNVFFIVRCVNSDGDCIYDYLWHVYDSGAYGIHYYNDLRPVVSLSSNVQLQATESGSATDYILN